jgi:hypothetical protein
VEVDILRQALVSYTFLGNHPNRTLGTEMQADAINTPARHRVLRLGSRCATFFSVANAGCSYTEAHQSSPKS